MAVKKVNTKQSEKTAKTTISSKDQAVNKRTVSSKTDKKSKKAKPAKKTNVKKAAPKKTNSKNIKKKAKKKIRVKKTFRQRLGKFFLWFFILMVAVGIVGAAGTGYFIKQAVDKTPEYDLNSMFSLEDKSILYDKDGRELGRIGGNNRESITFDELPQVFVDAMVAIEDSKFFVHNGVDYNRFGKAVLDVFTTGGFDGSGASTLTMQAAKNAVTNPGVKEETTVEKIERKLQDLYLATFVIEKNFTKEEIFEYYVNSNYLGGSAWGVKTASLSYFDKDVSDLNLAEASFIAGMFKAPVYYDPYLHGPERGQKRRNTVLDMMVRHGYISQEVCDATKAIPLESYLTGHKDLSDKYVDYINAVVTEVIEETGFDPYITPMKIYTYMDRELQDYLITIKTGEHPNIEFPDDELNLGLVMLDTETVQMRAVINGRNTVAKGINYATGERGRTHPGSTAKPIFDYAPCFEQEICYSTAQYVLDDSYGYYNGTPIYNWDRTYQGLITIEHALAASRNIPALRTFHQLENKPIGDFAASLGIDPVIENPATGYVFEAHSLGAFDGANALEMAAAYAAFANDGIFTEPSAVNYIVIDEGNEKINFEQESNRAMSSETAFMINHMLVQSVESDVALVKNLRENGIINAAKTGTSNWPVKYADELGTEETSRDLFLINYNPHYSIGYWMGYGKLTQEHVDNGWLLTRDRKNFRMDIIEEIYASGLIPRDDKQFEFSTDNIVESEYEKGSIPLKLPSFNTPEDMKAVGYFIKGTEPTEVSDRFLLAGGPGGLNASYDSGNGSITLTWNKAPLPRFQDITYLENYFKEHYSPNWRRHMMAFMEENHKYLGDVGYIVQLLDGDGNHIRDIDFIALANNSYVVSANDYAPHQTKGNLKFGLLVKYETGLTDGYAQSNSVKVDLTGKKHLISTTDRYDQGPQVHYQYIEVGTEFWLPEVDMYEPEKYDGQDNASTTDEYVQVVSDSGLILGPDQPRYVDDENINFTFTDDTITKVTVAGTEIVTGYKFVPTAGQTYIVEVTREIPNPDYVPPSEGGSEEGGSEEGGSEEGGSEEGGSEEGGSETPPAPTEPEFITEVHSFNLVMLKEDPVLSFKPKMKKVDYGKISKVIYYVGNGTYEQVGYIDTNRVGNYDVFYSYKNSYGYVVNAVKHFKVQQNSQYLLEEQLRAEDKIRKENLED